MALPAQCTACSEAIAEYAINCPHCGNVLQLDRSTILAKVFCGLSWFAALGTFMTAQSDIQRTLGAVFWAIGLLWLVVLRDYRRVNGAATMIAKDEARK